MNLLQNVILKNPELPVLTFDGDSVLLDWCKSFVSFLNQKGYNTDHISHKIGTTEFIPIEVITKLECKKTNKSLINEYKESDFLSKLEVFQDGAVEVLKELSKHYNIVVLTCIGETDEIVNKRTKNLVDLYGDIFSGIICINYGTSKEKHLSALNEKYNVEAFIDDRIGHIEESIKAGVKAILFTRGIEHKSNSSDQFVAIDCLHKINKYLQAQK